MSYFAEPEPLTIFVGSIYANPACVSHICGNVLTRSPDSLPTTFLIAKLFLAFISLLPLLNQIKHGVWFWL